MIYNYTSLSYLQARVVNNFGIEFSDWKLRSAEWVGEGLGLMNIYPELESVYEDVTVSEHLALIPCNLKVLEAVFYNGSRLTRSTAITNRDNDLIEEQAYDTDSYDLTAGGYIRTTFESGQVTFYFRRIPVDNEGYPKVPDDEKVIEALSWFILLRMLGRGYKHSVFNDYEKLEFKVMGQRNPTSLFAQARNSASDPDEDTRYLYRTLWAGVLPYKDGYGNKRFNDSGNKIY